VTLEADHGEPEIEALRVDRYLESILVARERGAVAVLHDPRLDAELRATAERLSSHLVRVHPSFRFEERLARRLADAGDALRLPAAAGAESSLPWPPVATRTGAFDPVDLLDPARPVDDDDPFGIRARPLLIGGALTSAAISLAGAALVAWRLSRPVHPMVRAIRAAHGRAGHQGGLA
jgi:hypothetical protein